MTNSGIWFFLSPIQDCTCGPIDPRQLYSQLRVSNLAWKAAFRAVTGDCFLNDTRWQRPQRFVWKNMVDGRLCDTPKFLNRREILSGFLIDWLSRMSKYGTFTVASGGISYQILDVTCELDTRFCMELRWIWMKLVKPLTFQGQGSNFGLQAQCWPLILGSSPRLSGLGKKIATWLPSLPKTPNQTWCKCLDLCRWL